MATNYRVTAPYVLLKIRDNTGRPAVNGFLAGAIVSDDQITDAESLQRHVDRGWIEPLEEPAADPVEEPEGEPGAGGDAGQEPGAGSGDGAAQSPPAKPSQADPKAAWVDYAVAQGLNREQAELMTKADLVELAK